MIEAVIMDLMVMVMVIWCYIGRYDTYGMVECCRYYMSMLIRAGTVR